MSFAAGNQAFGILSDGSLWAWGSNSNGQIGDGTNNNRNIPTKIGTATNWTAISGGYNHTLAIKSDGTLWSWGDNFYSQLGDGTNTSKNTPVQIGTSTDWISISAGFIHSVGIKSDGTLWAWGTSTSGQLGDGTLNTSNTPIQIGSSTNWIAVSAGFYHSVGIKSDGTLWAWGNNQFGQLGDGTFSNQNSPVQIGNATNWESISSGYYFTVGKKSDGTIWAWGNNLYGQLGDGTFTYKNIPTQVGTSSDWALFAAGGAHVMAIKTNGTLWTWGFNTYGQLGDGTSTSKNSPIQIGSSTNWNTISCGDVHTVASKLDGTLWAWGANWMGQLGDGTFTIRNTPTQICSTSFPAPTLSTFTPSSGSAGTQVTLTGTNLSNVTSLSIGGVAATLISKTATQIVATVGQGATTGAVSVTSPVGNATAVGNFTVALPSCGPFVKVSTGANHTVAIKSDGTLWAWGDNQYGQLGDGTNTNRNVITPIGNSSNWSQIIASYSHNFGIKSDGTLWAWGNNLYGQLGDGTTTSINSPVQIGIAGSWVSIGSSFNHTVGVKSDGTLWAWGNNDNGQLGDGTVASSLIPIQIGAGTDWSAVAAGENFTLALKSDGTIWSWGKNHLGQLGNGTNNDQISPIQIGSTNNWAAVFASGNHAVALKSNGTLWAWGYNGYGQIGDGSNTDYNQPLQIGNASNWLNVSLGNTFSTAIQSNGTLWAWGVFQNGEAIDGVHTNLNIPTQIGTGSNWSSISSLMSHAAVLGADGSLWTWGRNFEGQLGDGTTIGKSTPTQICSNTLPPPTLSTFTPNSGAAGTQVTLTGTNLNNVTSVSIGGVAATLVSKTATQIVATVGQGATTGAVSVNSPVGNATATGNFTVVAPSCGPFVNINAGYYQSVAVKSDGTLWAWGNNQFGQLGDGTTTNRNTPVQIGSDNDWTSVSSGYIHTLGIKTDGTLWSWGWNNFGQLGDGTNNNRNTPVQIDNSNNWVSVSSKYDHTLAIKADGTLWAWGRNDNGQLGDGTYTHKNAPVQIGIGSSWIHVSAGESHSLAVKSDGTLWAWGSNNNGQLGDGNNMTRNVPTQVGIANNWLAVAAANNNSFALRSNGTIWSINNNPNQIGNQTNWTSIMAGFGNTVALKSDGTLWAWGWNNWGQVGNGTLSTVNDPVQIGNANNWNSISTGTGHTLATRSDGTLWAWGYNVVGQLGDGSTTDKNTPTQICSNTFCPLPSKPDSIITRSDYVITDSVATFTVVPVSGATSYQWTLPSGWTFRYGQGTDSILVNTTQTGGMLQVAAVNACGIGPLDELNVIPYAPVTKPVLTGGSGTGVSAGSSTTISINPVPNATRYIWLIPPGFVLVSGGGENDTFAVVMPIGGGGTVTVTAQGPGGVSNSLTIPITVSQRWNPNNPLSKGPVMEWASARTPLITHYEKNIAVLENGDFALAGRTYLPSTQINFSTKDSFIETNAHSILAIYDSIGSIKNFILSPLAYSRILKAEDNGLIAIAKAVDANPIDFDPGPGTYYLDNQLLSNPATYIVKYNQQLQLQWAKALDADLSWLNLNAITRENGNFILATGKSANGFKWIGENGVEASFPANTNAGTILQFNTSGTLIQAFSGPNGIPSGMAINEELNDLYLLTGDLDTYKLTLSRYNLISDSSVSKELPGKYFIGQAAIQFNFHKLVIGQTIDALNEDLNYGTEQNPVIVPFSNTNQGTQIVLLCFNENLEINWAKGLLRNNSNSGHTNPLQDLVINQDSSIWISGFVQRGLSEPGNTLDFDPGPESFTPQLMQLANNPFAFNFIGTYTWNGDLISAFYPNQQGGESAFLAANTKGRLLHLSRGGIAYDENAQRIAVDQFNPRDPSFRIPVNNQFYQVQPNLYFNNPTAHLAMYKLGAAPGPRLVSPQNPEVCAGQTINLEATGTAPFSWFTQASGGIALQTGSSFSPPNLTQDTVFYLQDASYPSTARTAVSIRVNRNPVPVLTTPNAGSQGEFGNPAYNGNGGQLLCSGAVLFQALPAPGTDSIHQLVFNFGDGSPLDTLINQASVLHEFPVNNSINWFDPGFPNSRYTIQVTAISNKGCKTQTSLQRDIKNSPVAAITLESASSQALAGNRFQFRSASSNQHPSYIQSHTWLFSDSSTSSQTNPPSKTFLKTGDYSVKLVVSAQTGCTDTASVTIQVLADSLANSGDSLNPGSNACGLVAAFNVVNNDSVQELAANRFSFFNTSYHTGFGWANAYSWNFGDGTSSNNTFVYDKSYTQPGVYKVTLTASSSLGCIQSVSRYVRVTPSATTDFTFVSESCGSKTVSFAGQSSMPVNTWNWDFGDGNGSTQQNPTHTYANPGSYLVRLQINGSNQVVSKTVVIGEKPQQLAINPQALTCGNGYLFTGLASGSNLSYSWQFELQGAQGTLTGNQVYREYSQNGLENIRLTVSSGACSSTLELNNYPVLAAVAQAPLVFEARMIENGACETGIRFTAPLENNAIYLWDFGDGSKSETSSPVIFHAYQSTGTFYPTLTVKSESCSRFASQAVQVSAIGSGIPEAAFKLIYRPNTQCIVGNRYDFFNTTQLNSWGWVPGYQWDFGDGTSSTQTFIYGKSYTRPGIYTVSLRAISNVGCTTTVSTQVTVLDNPCDGITWGQKNTNLTSKDQITQESGFTTGLSQKSPIEYPIALYPNPSTGKTTLDLSKLPAMEVELVVYDALGRVWKLDNAKRKTGTETELNLEHLPNGQYHLHILSGTQQNRVLPLIIIR
ncbi:hypothetical protein MASR2M44_02230 [Bacteroidota bacterium]